MTAALPAMVSGAETCVDMALFGRSKEALPRRFPRLPGGTPSHDTFSRLFRLLDPAAFEMCFGRHAAALAERLQGVVAVDGKTARRSLDRQAGRGPLHLMPSRFDGAFARDTRLAPGQRKVDGKSNEITALPELLALSTLDGCIVTADAMHCQRATAAAIVARGGDDVLAGKGNQKTLLEDSRLLLDDPEAVPDAPPGTTRFSSSRSPPPDAVALGRRGGGLLCRGDRYKDMRISNFGDAPSPWRARPSTTSSTASGPRPSRPGCGCSRSAAMASGR